MTTWGRAAAAGGEEGRRRAAWRMTGRRHPSCGPSLTTTMQVGSEVVWGSSAGRKGCSERQQQQHMVVRLQQPSKLKQSQLQAQGAKLGAGQQALSVPCAGLACHCPL